MCRLFLTLVLLLASAATAAAQQRVRFDLGSAGAASKTGWNNLTAPRDTGSQVRFAVDDRGEETSVSLLQTDGWAGFNTKGHTGRGPYPPESAGDSFYLDAGIDDRAQLTLDGLTPGESYTLVFYASRMGGADKRKARYSVGEQSAELNAADNTGSRVKLERLQPDDDGTLTVAVEIAPGHEYAYLGVLELVGSFQRAEDVREPADSLTGPPFVTAAAWAIADGKTGQLLWGHREGAVRQMASTTKIMTAWIVLDLAEQHPKLLDEVVTVSPRSAATGGSSAKLEQGEQLPAGELLYGLMLPSGNDAAVALGEHFGSRFLDGESRDPPAADDSLAAFVEEMNRRAAKLGMTDTHYFDPHGNSANRSTARDLLLLARRAYGKERFRKYVSTRRRVATIQRPGGATREAVWKNTNQLLPIEGYDGIKTGTTRGAGACLVSSGHRGDDHLLMVVLGATSSDARYVDSRNLYRWAWLQRGHKPQSSEQHAPAETDSDPAQDP